MSSLATQLPEPWPEPVFRLSVEQYHSMIATGVITDDDPVELIEGILVQKMSKNPPHTYTLNTLAAAVRNLLPVAWSIRLQDPITLADGQPEPDLAIVRGDDKSYITRHPSAADVALVVEIADSTLPRDRGIKLRSYARAQIPIYWIVDLLARRVEIYLISMGKSYGPAQLYPENELVPVVIEGQQIGEIRVTDILVPARA